MTDTTAPIAAADPSNRHGADVRAAADHLDASASPPPTVSAAGARAWAAAGIAVVILMPLAMGGVGDAPDPHLATADITAWFTQHRDAVLASAPFGYALAVAVAMFTDRLARAARRGPARAVRSGGLLAAGYLAYLQVTYTSIAYAGAGGALFVPTILAVPAFAVGVAAALAGAAWSPELPRTVRVASAVGAATVLPAVVSLGDSGWRSPDVQQQIVGNVLAIWSVLCGLVLVRSRHHAVLGARRIAGSD